MGIDATIPDNVPRERFHRIAYAYADEVMLEDFIGSAKAASQPVIEIDPENLAAQIKDLISVEPLYFAELCERFVAHGFQTVT